MTDSENQSETLSAASKEVDVTSADFLASLKTVTLTEADYHYLSNADVESVEVRQFIALNNIENDECIIVALSDTGELRVMDTSMADFGTNHRASTDALRQLQQQTTEKLSLPNVILAEQEMGEIALDIVGINEPSVEVDIESNEKDPHLEKVFEPLVRPEVPPSKVDLMDSLFSGDEYAHHKALEIVAQEDRENAPIIKKQKDFDRLVNQDTREYSVQRMKLAVQRDPKLRQILHGAGFAVASLDAVDALRNDKELRYEVGIHLVEKLNKEIDANPDNFGQRIITNGQKANAYVDLGIGHMNSREYASWLALTKLSGMFNYKSESDTDTQYEGSRAVLGQHRDAADKIL